MRLKSYRTAVGLLVWALACAGEPMPSALRTGRTGGTPVVTLRDSVRLREPDSLPLGRAVSVAVDRAGNTYASDFASGRVIAFGPDGAMRWASGRRGGGPREFGGPDVITVMPGDTSVAVVDGKRASIVLLDAATGAFGRRISIPFIGAGRSWSFVRDTALFAVQNSTSLFARWPIGADTARVFGKSPEAAGASGFVALQYGFADVVAIGDSLLVQLPARPYLLVVGPMGNELGQIVVPAQRRLGQSDDLLAQHAKREAAGEPFTFLGSLAISLGRLADGTIGVLQADVDATTDPSAPKLRYFVSVLSRDLSKGCVDGEMHFETEAPMPAPRFIDGSIVAVARRLGADITVTTDVLTFDVTTEGCNWTPISRSVATRH